MAKRILLAAAGAAALASAGQAQGATTIATGSGFAIPDLGGGASSVFVSDGGLIEGLSVTLNNFYHDFSGDLIGTLSNGTMSVDLFNRPGVPESEYGNSDKFKGQYRFSDSAAKPIPELTALDWLPQGAYRPTVPFSVFHGGSAGGTWTLSIADKAKGDFGALGSWKLSIATDTPAVPEPSTWAMLLLGFGAVGALVRRRRPRTTLAYA
jgi:subtilisin-like proprotein convertase family protein